MKSKKSSFRLWRLGLLALAALAALLLAGVGVEKTAQAFHGQTVTAIPFQAPGYKYQIVPWGAGAGFESPAFDDSAWPTGQAAFGTNAGPCPWNASPPVATIWPVNTDLLLRKTFVLPDAAHNLRIRGTVDNDATVYLNGVQLTAPVLSGSCIPNAINKTAPDALLIDGTNLLAIRGHDFGVATFLDVEVVYDAVGPDLTVSKELKIGQRPTAGGTLSYLIRVRNVGTEATPAPPTTVQIIDTLPPGTSFVFATILRGTGRCQLNASGQVVCDLGANMPVGAETVVEIRIRTPNSGTITNTVEVDQNDRIDEVNEANNVATLVTVIP